MSIDLAIEGGVATVTINRPEAKNAITIDMREQLWTVFENLSENDDVRAVILTGAGGAFCAGMAVKEMGEAGAAWSMAKIRRLHRIARAIAGLKKTTVAAENGVCVRHEKSCALACEIANALGPAAT